MVDTEEFWAGDFGDDYNKRNVGKVNANIALFSQAFRRIGEVNKILEYGAGTGQNLSAISQLLPSAELMGVEINEDAASKIDVGTIFRKSAFDFICPPGPLPDMVITKGLLIHISPDDLFKMYEKIEWNTRRYVLMCEYYNPTPVSIDYRGHENKLWKRDFAGEFMDIYSSMKLIDYGFSYHRDPQFPQDDITWFLMERRK